MAKNKTQGGYFSVWPTAWGPMGAVAGEAGLVRVVLPHYQMKDLTDLLTWEHPGVARDDGRFARLAELTRDYFNAKVVDFGEIVCDMPAEASFSGKVIRACRAIPYGQTLTYSGLAKSISLPESARAVGTTMGKNAMPLVIPCHRVVAVGGGLCGFSAPGGLDVKRRMLELENKGIKA